MALIDDVAHGPVGVDTAAFIYFIEEDLRFLPVVVPLFAAVDDRRIEIVVSALALLEVLVVPYRAGNVRLAERYEALLTRSRGVRMIDLSRDLLRVAAQLRAQTGVATPDAMQLATAVSAGCSTFITNDRRLPDVSGLKILQIASYVG